MANEERPRWPTVVLTEKAPDRERVNLSKLPAEKKRAAWAWMQREEPELAAFLKSEAAQVLIKRCNGEVFLEFDETTTGG